MSDKSPAITLLRLIGKFLPGNYLKTTWYLYAVAMPRKVLRLALNGFYRIEHIYDVLQEVKQNYKGKFSVLEFGTEKGSAFKKMLYATQHLHMSDCVTVHAFDSFEGMPGSADRKDRGIVFEEEAWAKGELKGNYEELASFCAKHYNNYVIHKGYFQETLTEEFLSSLGTHLPILIWIDCDYYSSTRTVMERLIPYIPNGCVVYFDEYEWNYGSRFTGEARIVYEINNGVFGKDIELILDRKLSLDSQRVYRFMRFEGGPRYVRSMPIPRYYEREFSTNDSMLP
jgi:Macrocin-O-methyltransferase (TylF)